MRSLAIDMRRLNAFQLRFEHRPDAISASLRPGGDLNTEQISFHMLDKSRGVRGRGQREHRCAQYQGWVEVTAVPELRVLLGESA